MSEPWLLERVVRLEGENERLRDENAALTDGVDANYSLLQDANAEVERLREALTIYADHHDDCHAQIGGSCGCGFTAMLSPSENEEEQS